MTKTGCLSIERRGTETAAAPARAGPSLTAILFASPSTSSASTLRQPRGSTRRAGRARRDSLRASANFSVILRSPASTRSVCPARRRDRRAGIPRGCDLLRDMPKILLPLPRGSSGRSSTGKTSRRPSEFAAASSASPTAGTGAGASTRAAVGHSEHGLAGPIARAAPRASRRSRNPRRSRAPSDPPARRSAPGGTSRRRRVESPDSGSPCPRADGSVCAAGCTRGRCSRGTPRAACCGPARGARTRRRSCTTACADRDRGPCPARTQPLFESTTVTGSLATSSVSSIACAAARSTISLVRRASPYSSASASDLVAHELLELRLALEHLLELLALLGELASARRGSSSPRASRGGAAWSRGSPRPAGRRA